MAVFGISLVATTDRLRVDFPDRDIPHIQSAASRTGIMSAPYDVDTDACKSKLAAFLAEHIGTTRHDDDSSRVTLVYPTTQGDAMLKGVIAKLGPDGVGSHKFADKLDRIDAELKVLRGNLRM